MIVFSRKKIGELGRVVTGKTPSTARGDFFDGEFPFITIPDLDGRVVIGSSFRTLSRKGAENVRSSLLPARSVMMSCIATVGKCGITDRPSLTNQQINSVIPNDDVDPFFLYYVFRDIGQELQLSGGGGSVYTNASKSRFSDIEVDVPPLREQRAIAATLGALDDKIDLNRRMNETLEALARALFKDWFVDFGPTRAKMEGREPYLARDIWDLFPDRLVETGHGKLPEGWEVKPLSEIADFLNGLALQKYPASDPADGLPVIKISELRNGVSAKTDKASRRVPEKYIVKNGDFLFSWSGSLLAKFWTQGKGALNQHLFKVTSQRYPRWFFSEWVQIYLEEFKRIADSKATTMGHIQRRHLQTAMINCPPDDAIATLGQTIAPLVDRTIQSALESRTLAALRDTLLPKLMSGEIRVGDAGRTAREVT